MTFNYLIQLESENSLFHIDHKTIMKLSVNGLQEMPQKETFFYLLLQFLISKILYNKYCRRWREFALLGLRIFEMIQI
jgi:hypothetical protein